MGKKQEEYKQLTREELNAIAGEELPERAAMFALMSDIAARSGSSSPASSFSSSRVSLRNS